MVKNKSNCEICKRMIRITGLLYFHGRIVCRRCEKIASKQRRRKLLRDLPELPKKYLKIKPPRILGENGKLR